MSFRGTEGSFEAPGISRTTKPRAQMRPGLIECDDVCGLGAANGIAMVIAGSGNLASTSFRLIRGDFAAACYVQGTGAGIFLRSTPLSFPLTRRAFIKRELGVDAERRIAMGKFVLGFSASKLPFSCLVFKGCSRNV